MKKTIILCFCVLLTACGSVSQAEEVSNPEIASDPTSTPTSLPAPTATPTLRPTQTNTPEPTPTEVLPSNVFLSPLNTQWQSHNNCERASIAIALGYYDVWIDQHDIESCVHNMPAAVGEYGLYGRIFKVDSNDPVTMDYVVRWLLSQEIPVIVGGVVSRTDDTWHFRVVQGYDDENNIFFLNDSLLGLYEMDYEEFNYIHRTMGGSVMGDIIPVYEAELDSMILEKMRSWGLFPITF